MVEAGMKDYEVVGWYALVGPKKLPDAVAARLTRALNEVSSDPAFRQAMTDGGYTINTGDSKRCNHASTVNTPCGPTSSRAPTSRPIEYYRSIQMNPPLALHAQTRLPVIGAPMFLVSGPDLVVAQCAAGIIGTFPSLNARPQEQLHDWLTRIELGLAAKRQAAPDATIAPYGVNLIVHPSNPRWQGDLAICAERRVPLIITSLHAPEAVVAAVHGYGGLVFHDVTNVRHANARWTPALTALSWWRQARAAMRDS